MLIRAYIDRDRGPPEEQRFLTFWADRADYLAASTEVDAELLGDNLDGAVLCAKVMEGMPRIAELVVQPERFTGTARLIICHAVNMMAAAMERGKRPQDVVMIDIRYHPNPKKILTVLTDKDDLAAMTGAEASEAQELLRNPPLVYTRVGGLRLNTHRATRSLSPQDLFKMMSPIDGSHNLH